MSETPVKGLKKFHTISPSQKVSKSVLSTTAFRRTQRNSNSVLTNPETLLGMTTPNFDANLSLPKIKGNKKKQKKQGTYLQSWLDEALGSPDPFAVQKPDDQDKIQGNVLKTLKKFELDKRYLQSQNLPTQKIEKLYKSLYIYSHGVNKIFEDLLQLTRETGNGELLNNFWRAYSKLLQSCTSYQTVFQKVEKDHLGNIQRLKMNMQIRGQQFSEQKKQFAFKFKKLQKQIEQKQVQYQNLKIEYDVLQNTLNLTDESFNQEVNLRLKFEEKINAIYTCYEELKNKYAKIVQEMGIKNLDIIERDNIEQALKNKLLVQKTKVDELMFLLKAEREKVKERETEIIIKNQELEDAKSLLLARTNEEETTNDKMEEHLMKLKALKAKMIELENVISGQKITIKQQDEHIKKLLNSLEEYKQANSSVYEKYANAGKKIVSLESNIESSDLKILDLEKSGMQKSVEISNLTRELNHTKEQRDCLRNDLAVSTKNLNDTRDTMGKNSIKMDEMKAVKDKYQRINEFLKVEVKQLEESRNKCFQQLGFKTEEVEGLKLLLDNKGKAVEQLQKHLQNQKQSSKMKVNALNLTITKKQNLAIEYQKKKEEQEKETSNLKSVLKMTQDKCILLQSQKMKVEVQLNGKIKLLTQLQKIITQENARYKDLNLKFEGQLKNNSDINWKLMTTEFVLKTKNEQERLEVSTLSALLQEYKRKIIERAQYVHPMLYQQALQFSRRCAFKQEIANKQLCKIKSEWNQFLELIQKLQSQNKQKTMKILQLQEKCTAFSDQKSRLNENIRKIEQKFKGLSNLHQKQKQMNTKIELELQAQKLQIKNKTLKIKQLEQLVSITRIKLEQLVIENNRKKTSRSETREIKRQPKKQTCDIECQTEFEENKIQQKNQPQKIQKEVQTEVLQDPVVETTMVPIYKQEPKLQPVKKEELIPQKKVETKQFKRALKLTYMRR